MKNKKDLKENLIRECNEVIQEGTPMDLFFTVLGNLHDYFVESPESTLTREESNSFFALDITSKTSEKIKYFLSEDEFLFNLYLLVQNGPSNWHDTVEHVLGREKLFLMLSRTRIRCW